MSKCAMPDCDATLCESNTSGVCRDHNHSWACTCIQCSGGTSRPKTVRIFDGETPEISAQVVINLRDGYGVEDMQVMGVCSADYARKVVSRLRYQWLLRQVVIPQCSQ